MNHFNIIFKHFVNKIKMNPQQILPQQPPEPVIESPFQKVVISTRYKSIPQPTDSLLVVKRKMNLEIQNTEIFNKVKVPPKIENDKIIEYLMGSAEDDTFKVENDSPPTVILCSVTDCLKSEFLTPELLNYRKLIDYVNTLTNAYLMNNTG
jgi:hypothetical protein